MAAFRNHCKSAGLESWEFKLLLLCSPNRFLITANIQCFSSAVSGLIIFSSPPTPRIKHLSTKQKQIKKKCKYNSITKAASVWIFRLWGINSIAIIRNYFPALKEKKMQAVKKKKKIKKKIKKRQQQLVYRNICKTGMKLQVLSLKTVKEEFSSC